MSFLTAGALFIGLLVGIPILAHLLRRGRVHERLFPAAALVAPHRAVARQTSRLEDRSLLALRGALILVLAALAATPLVRCSRLSLARNSGASVAMALVLDDSLSMRAQTPGGVDRWERAIEGAKQLVRSAREGDAVAVILAGRPARLALAPTTDLAAVKKVLDTLSVSDRATDIDGAVKIARSAILSLPQVDKRVVLLSDLAGAPIPAGSPPAWVPIAEIAQPIDDCGITSALQSGRTITVEVRCTSEQAAADRRVEVTVIAEEGDKARDKARDDAPKPSASHGAPIAAQSGTQVVSLTSSGRVQEVRLTGTDAIAEDDRAATSAENAGILVGVISDPAHATVVTGGPTLLVQALDALDRPVIERPLTLVPDDAKELADLSGLIIDDPSGLTPEMRSTLVAWLQRGGVALALLGPRAEDAQLGSNLEPFARGRVHWETTEARGLDAKTAGWLGKEAQSLTDLGASGRAHLAGTEMPSARVSARWNDGEPWSTERDVGMGLAMTVSLPSSPDTSDLALRPGFLALLDRVVQEASLRNGSRTSIVGTPWAFPEDARVEITGPGGKLELTPSRGGPGSSSSAARSALPTLAGRYHVRVDGEQHDRIVWIDPEEVTTVPGKPGADAANVTTGSERPDVDISPETALFIVALFAGELALRAVGRIRARRRAA